jgi:hypothetical protein
VAVYAEELDHPVKGLYDSNKHDGKDKASFYPVQRLPFQEKEEEGDQGNPFEKFDLGCEGDEGYWGLRIADCGLNITKLKDWRKAYVLGERIFKRPEGSGRIWRRTRRRKRPRKTVTVADC